MTLALSASQRMREARCPKRLCQVEREVGQLIWWDWGWRG